MIHCFIGSIKLIKPVNFRCIMKYQRGEMTDLRLGNFVCFLKKFLLEDLQNYLFVISEIAEILLGTDKQSMPLCCLICSSRK